MSNTHLQATSLEYVRGRKSVEYVHQRTILTTYISPQLTILQAAKKLFREFKVVFIKMLTDEPWILSGYRQIVTVYFSVCETGYVSIYLTNNFYTSIVFYWVDKFRFVTTCPPSLLTYYRRYVCSYQFLSYQSYIKSTVN